MMGINGGMPDNLEMAAVKSGPTEATTKSGRASTRTLSPGLMADRLSFRLRSVLGLLGERVTEAFAPFGLRAGSFTSMALIAANPGCSQIELSREGGLEKSSLVSILNELEERGYAVRARSKSDKRRSNLYLTTEGEAVMQQMYTAAMATEVSIRSTFTESELQQLFMLLERTYFILANEDT
jgi:DNA-binding MarR family transcriptional regulator